MEFISANGEDRYAAVARAARDTVVGLDLDGTLSPIVDDPSVARIHPDAADVLVALAEQVATIAIITGRPARQALALGGLDRVGERIDGLGKELHIFGQYGNERWSSVNHRIVSPRPPQGLGGFLLGLPSVLRRHDALDAYVEEKGLAVAVHTRRLPEPEVAFGRLLPVITDLAQTHGLTVEPGRSVIEVRAPGTHKGDAVHKIATETRAKGFVFAGDDLGDLEAFNAVDQLASSGLATLLVCSSSEEQRALLRRADVAVAGPEGVLDLLRQLTEDAARTRM